MENMTMESADENISYTKGKVRNLPITIGPITYYVQAQVVQRSPTAMLLGLPFWALANCHKDTYADGFMSVTLSNPNPPFQMIVVPTTPRGPVAPRNDRTDTCEAMYNGVIEFGLEYSPGKRDEGRTSKPPHALQAVRAIEKEHLAPFFPERPSLDANARYEQVARGVYVKTKYKPVAKKVTPIPGTLPEEFKIIRRFPSDPLENLPPMPEIPPPFVPGQRLTQERWDAIEEILISKGFLWKDEIQLVAAVLKQNEMAIAWDDSEKGQFRTNYFEPVKMPTIAHVPWVEKNMRIPPAIRDKLIMELRRKIEMGVIEPSNSSYRCHWFAVPKKDGKLRLVWNLEPLNRIMIHDAGVPPIIDEVIEGFAGHTCYSLGDIYIGYDHRLVDPSSRDFTTFQTPLGPFRLTTLPMGWTNSVTIFHQDVCFILQDEIPDVAQAFIDDVGIKGPKDYYRREDGSYETISGNKRIRKFVWEHLTDVNRILHRFKHAGATFAAKKLAICVPEVSILGHTCTHYERKPDQSHIQKILDWPECKNLPEVCGFLGVTGLVRIFIKDYSKRAYPLNSLTKKTVEFTWAAPQIESMRDLKQAATTAPALKSIDYKSGRKVILAIDSSPIGMGYVLFQEDEQGKRHPARYGSVTWKDAETRYSQAKLELYGLMRALRDVRPFIFGVTNLTVEVDAAYIKGMLNNPDETPNATLNRWIAYIQLFTFTLVHVPAENHKGPDGLSRRFPTADEQAREEDDIEEEIDRRLEGFYVAHSAPRASVYAVEKVNSPEQILPRNPITMSKDRDLETIKEFLRTLEMPPDLTSDQRRKLARTAHQFFLHKDKMYKRQANLKHQRYIEYEGRLRILTQVHDETGHKGYFPTQRLLRDRFWWPNLATDLKWYLETCHECQIRNMFKLRITPTVPEPASLFSKVYCDTMFMEKHGGYRYIAHARCSLTAWPEWRPLRKENAQTLGQFLFEEIMCRWGAIQEIVTDNGKPWVKALEHLREKYHITHIRISPYNSQAQGVVERQHLNIRESIVKACEGKLTQWPTVAPYCFWADRITTRRSTGHSPYYMAHGTEPIMPFDIAEATYLVPELETPKTTEELIALRARQLEKQPEDLERMKQQIWQSRKLAASEFVRRFETSIRRYNILEGELVLVRNSAKEMDLGKKWKPRYLGPYVVVNKTENGTYVLAEMDGTISNLRFAARRVIPYYWRQNGDLPDANELVNNAGTAE